MKAAGKEARNTAKESRFLLQVSSMMVNGKKTKGTERVLRKNLMVKSSMETGRAV